MHTQLTPKDIIDNSKRIVIKIGTETILKDGKIDLEWLNAFAEDIAELKKQDKEIFVVTSGAIGLGRGVLNLNPTIPTKDIPLRIQQKASTVGQTRLMQAYSLAFEKVGLIDQQILLTKDIVDNDKQLLNLRSTCLSENEDCGILRQLVPVINEDDALATDEITFGDNDQLGAMVTRLLGADLYILLSKQSGLFTDNPAINPKAIHLPIAPDEETANGYANDDLNGVSRGGMKSKLKAAFKAALTGAHVIMAKGQGITHCLRALASNDHIYKSTIFIPSQEIRAIQRV